VQKGKKDISYDPVTGFVDSLLKPKQPPIEPQFAGEKLTGISLEQLKEKIVDGVTSTNWFITGRVDYRLFSSNFKFKDPSVKVSGIEEYAAGVFRLFNPESTMDIVSTKITGDREIEMVWRLEAVLNLPFSPKIKAYYVTTYFRTDDEGLVCEQEEFFSIPEWELIVSIFFPNVGTPPAPPVEK